MTASLIAKLSETAKAALCYLAQEPDAYVSIMKETSSLTKQSVVCGASVHNADGKAATYCSSGNYPNKTSLAALLTKGLIECILPPKCAVDQPRFRNAYASFQYANLSDKGRKVAEALLAEEKPAQTEGEQLLAARQNCDSEVRLHQGILDREQSRYDAAVAKRDKAQDAYVASGADFSVLNAPQEAILAVCLAPENRNRNIILLGMDASRPILRTLATELSAGGNAKDVWYVTSDVQGNAPRTLRPSTIIAEYGGNNLYGVYTMKRVLRTGGRIIVSADANDAHDFELSDPLVINVKDCH